LPLLKFQPSYIC